VVAVAAHIVNPSAPKSAGTFRTVFGGFLATGFLLLLADGNENLAKGFALLILFGSLLVYGADAGKGLANALGGTPQIIQKGGPLPAPTAPSVIEKPPPSGNVIQKG
jgi:hypothetical protein